MKTLKHSSFLSLVILLVLGFWRAPVSAQAWNVVGDDIFSNTIGLVSIGASTPKAKLDVNLPADLGDNAGIQITAPFAFAASQTQPSPDHYFHIRRSNFLGGGYHTRFTVRTNGKVGINIENPEARLHVNGAASSDEDLLIFSSTHSNGYTWAYSRHGIENDRGYWAFNAKLIHEDWFVDIGSNNAAATKILQGGGGMYFQYYKSRWVYSEEHNWEAIPKDGGWANAMHIRDSDGKIGMGTSNFVGDFRLYVAGGILAERCKVELQGNWPDFVFAEDHPLTELDEVEQFIEQNHHLPGVPSAKEVKEDGIDLGNMDATLLEKIEELTLYVIQLKKENDQLKQEVKDLQTQQH